MPLQRKTLCFGWTGAEIRMWLSLTSLLAGGMAVARFVGAMDYFRIVFFSSPMLAVVVLGPMQKDKRLYKLLFYSGGAFVAYWLTMQSYPTQCRHAWGTRMVSDTNYWNNEQAQRAAIMKEKDNFYVLKDVTDKEDQEFFVGGTNKTRVTPTAPPPGVSMDTVWGLVKDAHQKADGQDAQREEMNRIHKWIAPLTAGGSLDILRLRAYCNLHILDQELPHVFPLRVLGLETDWSVPCPYWSCVLTEATSGGKQIFWIIVAIAGAVNFLHYRMDCACCQWWFGSGVQRVFWGWFWATLLPFLAVLLIKTTVDDEIGIIISNRVRETEHGLTGWFSTTRHQIYFGVGASIALTVYIQWEKVRDALGIPAHPLAQCFLSRSQAQDAMDERTFQVCVWRIDMQRDHSAAMDAASPRGGSDDSDNEYNNRQSSRSFLFGSMGASSPTKFSLMRGGLFGREEDQDTLRTSDGRRPTIVVRFFYGSKEIQKTRAVRPTQSEWNNKHPVYIQENFRCMVPHRSGTPFRVEVQDTGAPLGTVSIGEVTFDEQKMRRQFEDSRRSQRDASQVPVHQVIKMLEAAGGRGIEKDQQSVKQLRSLGFASHMLSDGGAIWLAFCETDLAAGEAGEGLLCCGGA